MSPSSSVTRKVNGLFGPSSKKEWTETAKRELSSANLFNTLVHRIDGIDVLPYYDYSDVPAERNPQLPSSQNEFAEPRKWSNQPRVTVRDAFSANQEALAWLNDGADGILFELQGNPDLDKLLKNIELNYCQTGFLVDTGHDEFINAFVLFVKQKKIKTADVEGAVFWKESIDPQWVLKRFQGWDKFHPLGIVNVTPSPVCDEIALLLAKAVMQIDRAGTQHAHDTLRAIAFMTTTQTDLFFEIAKLKSLRSLFGQVAREFHGAFSSSMYIHSVASPRSNLSYEPHGNLIKNAFDGLSAILGGCNALTIDADDPSMVRVALNTSSVLKEESHLGKVSDPTAGSFFLESLADKVGRESWSRFQALLR